MIFAKEVKRWSPSFMTGGTHQYGTPVAVQIHVPIGEIACGLLTPRLWLPREASRPLRLRRGAHRSWASPAEANKTTPTLRPKSRQFIFHAPYLDSSVARGAKLLGDR